VAKLELMDTAPAPAATPDRTATVPGGASILAPSAQLPTGKQLGHFRIERPLGSGGMGEVYLAQDLALDRPVAVKVLPEGVSRDPKRRDRMIREARAQARVAHPNVGHIYFVGEDDGLLYFAMEYVAGDTLAERISKGPMPVEDALAVIRAATLGLREAERSGITHRDVKPSNLMIDGHGVVKVLDFGLAAGGLEGERAESGAILQTSLAGTPLYMAPEQARGEAVDFRSDIYALGATLYHLIAGKPPFEGDSVDELITKHASAARPQVPRKGQRRVQLGALDALLLKMMAAKPSDRFASYEELLRALDLASDSESRPAGFWVRSVAMTLDFAAIAIIIVSIKLGVTMAGLDVENIPLVFPLFALLQVWTTHRGTTFGKTVMELEVIDVETLGKPSISRAIRRTLMMLGVPLVSELVQPFVEATNQVAAEQPGFQLTVENALGILTLVWMIAAFTNLAYASLRASGRRTWWDRVGRTMVRYRTTRRSLAPGS
jgi:hypothetical protein